MGTACLTIARLGGALNRNSRETPGPQTMLRGLRRFYDIGLGFTLGGRKDPPPISIVVNELMGHAQA